MFQAQNRETINSTLKVAVSFKIVMTTSVTRSCFTKQHQNCKTKTTACKTKTIFWSQTGLALRPTVSDHITDLHGRKRCAGGLLSSATCHVTWNTATPRTKSTICRDCTTHTHTHTLRYVLSLNCTRYSTVRHPEHLVRLTVDSR